MARQRLAKNAAAAIVQVVLTGAILFELYRFLNRHLTVEQIGVWSIVLASAAVGRVVDLGLGGGVVKFVAEHLGRGERQLAVTTIQMSFVGMTLFTGAVCLVFYPALYALLAHLIHDSAGIQVAR
jgi:O-antigen/teichoic acid export membrane protein